MRVMKALPVLFALLLALAPIGAAAFLPSAFDGPVGDTPGGDVGVGTGPGAGPPRANADVLSNRSVHVLALRRGSLARSQVELQSPDIGPALTFDRDAARTRLGTLTMVERIQSVETTDQRQRLILDALNGIEQEIITLRTAQQRAISQYADGSTSTRAFALQLADIDARARALEHRRSRLAELASETESIGSTSRRFSSLERELETFTGPVRHRVGNVVAGQNESTRVFVAAAPDGLVLSTIVNGTYVREAYRGDLRNLDADQEIDPETALNVTSSQYPTVWATKVNSTEVVGAGGLYRVSVPYRYGTLTTFLDGENEQIFKEYQARSLSSFPPEDTVTRSRDGLRMTINRSYAGGPVRISLADAQTNAPVNANVTIGPQSGGNSDFVGYTGSDGVLWALSPAEQYTVFAIRGNSVVAVDTGPVSPPRVYPTNNSTANNSTSAGPTTQQLTLARSDA